MKKSLITMGQEEYKEWNEEMFKKYYTEKQYYHPNPIIRYTENKRVGLTIKFLKPEEGDKILSVGCGEGYLLNKLEQGKIWGVDLSEEAIRRARVKNQEQKNIILSVADALKLPFPNAFFNKAECSETIEHVPEPSKLIDEIIRVTTDEAVIVFTYPNEGLINRIKKILIKVGLFGLILKEIPKIQEWHLHFFDFNKFNSLIKNKLIIEKVKSVPFSWFPVRYIVKCKKIETKS